MTKVTRTFLACLVLLSLAAPAVAQTAGSEATVEGVSYAASGNVSTPGSGLTLWQSSVHEFSVTISSSSGFDGEACLVTTHAETDGHRELACEPTAVDAGESRTVAVSVDGWPANLTGDQDVAVLLRAGDGSEIARDGVPVTVFRTDGDPDGDGLTNEREASLGTDLRAADTDGDGLGDGEEVETYGTSPTTEDTDGDGLTDRAELQAEQTDPTKADSDGDGLTDPREQELGTNPNEADTDGDGLEDGPEVNVHETDPSAPDSDGDGLDDGAEINDHDTNPTDTDTDGDGLTDDLEISPYGTDPNKIDTDGDGLEDGAEVHTYDTDPAVADTDDDGLSDGREVNTHGTNPTNPDSDGDGLDDGAEVNRFETNPNEADTDGDGRSDRAEVDTGILSGVAVPAVVIGAVLVIVTVGGLRYRTSLDVANRLDRVRRAIGPVRRPRRDGAAAADADDGDAEEIPPEFLSNEERVLALLDEHDGRMRQTEIVEETAWSKSKVSRVLAEMAEDERIVKVDIGRGNVVTRPEDVPPGARSPFDES